MAKQQDLDRAYMRCAEAIALLSHARRRKVGAIIVKDNSIIAESFNGTPSGFDNDPEELRYRIGDSKCYESKEWVHKYCTPQGDGTWLSPHHNVVREVWVTKDECLHAESNAIAKVARSTNKSTGAILYCTLEPCFGCAKLIIQAGIKRVVYKEAYVSEHGGANGIGLLKQAGIVVEEYNNG